MGNTDLTRWAFVAVGSQAKKNTADADVAPEELYEEDGQGQKGSDGAGDRPVFSDVVAKLSDLVNICQAVKFQSFSKSLETGELKPNLILVADFCFCWA